jgi:uncharacterized protein YidB (DUF937 family)
MARLILAKPAGLRSDLYFTSLSRSQRSLRKRKGAAALKRILAYFFKTVEKTAAPLSSPSKSLINTFIEENGGIDAVLDQINAKGFGYKIAQINTTLSNSFLNSIELIQIFGLKEIKRFSQTHNVDEDWLLDEIVRNLPKLIKK